MQPSKLAGILSNVNRILKRKTVEVESSELFAVSQNRASTIYGSLSYNQKKVIDKISEDLRASHEFKIDAVIAYSVLKFFITGDMWVFDNEDTSKLKSEIKKINSQMSKKQYIQDINNIMMLIDTGSISAKRLIYMKDGSSLLCNFVLKNKLSIFAAAKFADWYETIDTEYESEQHKNFRKVLNIFSGLSY